MVTFSQISEIEKRLAVETLTQLYSQTSYARSGMTGYDASGQAGFTVGNEATFIRPKVRSATTIDPVTTAMTFTTAESTEVRVRLNKYSYDGFPVFTHDVRNDILIAQASQSSGNAIAKEFEDGLYSLFRDYTAIPATGEVALTATAPLKITFLETSGGALAPFQNHHLAYANASLIEDGVPAMGLFAHASPTALADWGLTAPVAEGQPGALAGGGVLLSQGLPPGAYISRHGLMLGSASAITGQVAVTDLGDGNPTEAISAFTQDTTVFFDGEVSGGTTPLGAVRCTIDVTAALIGLAVGQIARLGPDAGPAKAYGVILRVDVANKQVWLVPYNAKGKKLMAAELSTTTDKIGVPYLPYVHTAHHQEFLAYASRPMQQPRNGLLLPVSLPAQLPAISLNLGIGSWDGIKEAQFMSLLWGAKATDYRKAVLMLSA